MRVSVTKLRPFNPTNHAFFNVTGDPSQEVGGTYLTLNARETTTVSDDLIPDGGLASVLGGPLDFTSPKKLGDDLFAQDHMIQLNGGFDHNFCVDGEGFRKFGEAFEPESGRVMGSVVRSARGAALYLQFCGRFSRERWQCHETPHCVLFGNSVLSGLGAS